MGGGRGYLLDLPDNLRYLPTAQERTSDPSLGQQDPRYWTEPPEPSRASTETSSSDVILYSTVFSPPVKQWLNSLPKVWIRTCYITKDDRPNLDLETARLEASLRCGLVLCRAPGEHSAEHGVDAPLSYATLSGHDEIICSPVPSTVRPDLDQSTGDT